MPPRLLRLTRLGAPLAACAFLAAHADPAAPPPAADKAAAMPTVRLLMPRRAGDPILMIDENGIARELPKQGSAASAPAARPKPDAAAVPAAAAPVAVPAPAVPPAPAPAPAAAPQPASIAAPAPVPASSPAAAPARGGEAPKAGRLGDLSDDERRRLAAMPLPQLPVLAAPAAAQTAPAATGAATSTAAGATLGAGEVETVAAELERANDRIGLGDDQLAKIQAAKTLAASGKESAALAALIGLNHELDAATALYVVKRGEALRQIAARPEVYGNANLWPLIRDASGAALRDPSHIVEGQKLRVPRYPSAAAAAQAIEQARATAP